MKFKFKLIHLEALTVYLIYTIGTKIVFFDSLIWGRELKYYIPGPTISVFFGILFLYLFSHEGFFQFAKVVERREKKTEVRWLRKLVHFGKILTVFLIAILSGPLLSALATRFLFKNTNTRYFIIFLACAFGSLLTLVVVKGGMAFFLWR